MIDVATAVENANAYLKKFYPDVKNVLLEEAEPDETSNQWLITLSFPDLGDMSFAIYQPQRKYKLFKIDGETGVVRAMKIRDGNQ
jgi:hypothetical protein